MKINFLKIINFLLLSLSQIPKNFISSFVSFSLVELILFDEEEDEEK